MISFPPKFIPPLPEDLPITHTWDDWDPYPLFGDEDEALEARLARVSDRAQIAFSIACAEWVVYRFRGFYSDKRLYEFIESAWASEMSSDYVMPPRVGSDEWLGPVKGPLDLAFITVINTFYSTEDAAGEVDAAFASKLPLHVLPDDAPFIFWMEQVLNRLEKFFPRNDHEPLGMPVPREAMDPTVPIQSETMVEQIKSFFSNLDEIANPLLRRIANPAP
jgi:hypothetical protein